ncbi:hypothetical protein GPLA_0700 [Paraglaciecola polaris LMG 21857]|uniref:Uncharacterized protein n=1 Tax=Paraglaciecola polaris LMG 21857 TaxID=1129793 RepID=K6Z5X8_9ALTE|nr:hypothetical protein GPLA_0700 [Paraglaciecola polaris LMG 21857]
MPSYKWQLLDYIQVSNFTNVNLNKFHLKALTDQLLVF